MHNKKIKKLLKKPQPNSGFTLTELLTGLIMSIFVTGALGFGLYQIMSATGAEKAKTNARNEASRAVEFISDELRRAQSIDPDASDATGFTSSGKTVVLALNIPELNSTQSFDIDGNGTSGKLGSDENDSTPERIVYYLKSTGLGNWQGPQVLYRYGPPLNANGEYTENAWQEEALIDGIDDTPVTNTDGLCDAGYTLTTEDPSGFYACINGTSTAAQIFLTGGIDTLANYGTKNDSNYTAKTKAVARAKDVDVNSAETKEVAPISFRSLEADYVCHPTNPSSSKFWTMRTDFDNSDYDSSENRPNKNNATKWIHEPGRQAQPIDIDSNADLVINSIPIGAGNIVAPASDCISTGNQSGLVSDLLSSFVGEDGIENQPGKHSVAHTIKFKQQIDNRENDTQYYRTFNGDTENGYDNPNVSDDGKVQVFKNGSRIVIGAPLAPASVPANDDAPARGYLGYKSNGSNDDQRPTLGQFLIDKGFAECSANCDNENTEDDEYTIINLEPDERIIAFEIGQDDNGYTENANDNEKPAEGFDLQDNVFILKHEAFKDKHPKDIETNDNYGEGSSETNDNYGTGYQ